MPKKAFIVFSILSLIYLIMPGPKQISDFKPLPNSAKSSLEGDTIQIPNVSAYFSNIYRNFVVSFYLADYRQKTYLLFPPLKLNHPPEYSWKAIKRHTDSTYLEEFVYPLRDSLYVNGFEPFDEDGKPKFWGSKKLNEGENLWYTKTTLRFYPSSIFVRLIVWFGIWLAILFLYKLGRKIIFS